MNLFLNFSDAAKFADVARNIVNYSSFTSNFNFWGTDNSMWIRPVLPYSITIAFKFFGINDFAVIATTFFYFLAFLVFVYLLTNRLYKDKLTSVLATIAVGFNYNLINYATNGASESPFVFGLLGATYFLTVKKWWGNLLGLAFIILMYFTRPQAIIYIFALVLYYFVTNFSFKRAAIYTFIFFLIGTTFYLFFSKQGLIAITQNLPGMAVSDSLRGSLVSSDLTIITKKVFYNLYNFYKAFPEIINPYLLGIFILSLFIWSKDKIQISFKISTLFVTLLTFLVTALTIPFYRYIHPIIPLIYIVAVRTLVQIVSRFASEGLRTSKQKFIVLSSTFLVLFFCVGETLGIIFLDSRFERKIKNTDKAPIYVSMSYKLKEITSPDQIVLTNLDTWGSWYGERKTIWFPLKPEMIQSVSENIDAIYLTSYKMDDDNYYMGEKWREIFNNPEGQEVLPEYKFVESYEFKAEDNYENENGRSILLIKKK